MDRRIEDSGMSKKNRHRKDVERKNPSGEGQMDMIQANPNGNREQRRAYDRVMRKGRSEKAIVVNRNPE
jgi:hypothetical protein